MTRGFRSLLGHVRLAAGMLKEHMADLIDDRVSFDKVPGRDCQDLERQGSGRHVCTFPATNKAGAAFQIQSLSYRGALHLNLPDRAKRATFAIALTPPTKTAP
jgi:hypothetical protein